MRKFTILAGTSLLLIGSAAAAQHVQGPTDTGAPVEAAPADTGVAAGDPATDSALPEADAGLPEASTAPDASTAAPGDSAAPATSDTEVMAEANAFTDAEIQSFAAAALEIQNMQTEGTASQEQAASIVASSGLDAETFNAIGQAMQSDPEIAERVQLAAAELQGGAEPQG